MLRYLSRANVRLKDFAGFTSGWTDRVRAAARQLAEQHQRPLTDVPGRAQRKELLASARVHRVGLANGLIGHWSVVEPVPFQVAPEALPGKLALPPPAATSSLGCRFPGCP